MFKNKKTSPQVLIAGAGPAGLVAAIALARRGVRVQIADSERETAAHSYALALHPSTLRLFDRLGLLPEVLSHCYRVDHVGVYEGAEKRHGLEMGKLSRDCPFLAVMPQSSLETLLEKTLTRLGVRVQWSHRVTRFDADATGITATVDRLVTESIGYAIAHTARVASRSTEVHPEFLIGADGHQSLVRRGLEIDFDEVGPAQNFAVFEFWSSVDLGNEMRVVFNERDTNVLWPLPAGRCRWSFELEDFEPARDRIVRGRVFVGLGPARFPVLEAATLHELIAARAPWFKGEIDDIAWRMVVRFERRLASSFGRERAWLVGDAGHMTGPVAAQSMNVGIREAFELAEIMAGILKEGGSTDRLAEYGSSRRAEWRGLLGLEQTLEASGSTDPWVRSRVERILPCIPSSNGDMVELAGQLGLSAVTSV